MWHFMLAAFDDVASRALGSVWEGKISLFFVFWARPRGAGGDGGQLLGRAAAAARGGGRRLRPGLARRCCRGRVVQPCRRWRRRAGFSWRRVKLWGGVGYGQRCVGPRRRRPGSGQNGRRRLSAGMRSTEDEGVRACASRSGSHQQELRRQRVQQDLDGDARAASDAMRPTPWSARASAAQLGVLCLALYLTAARRWARAVRPRREEPLASACFLLAMHQRASC